MELDPDSIAELAADIARGLSGARLHGAMVGALCGEAAPAAGWARVLEAALGDVALAPHLPQLGEMLSLAETALADPQYGFEPLLPDAEARLGVRVQALADWCDAFLLAFAAAAREPVDACISAEGGELLADLTAIAGGLDPAAMDLGDGDENEEDFMQILEFVRVATLSLYAERHADAAALLH